MTIKDVIKKTAWCSFQSRKNLCLHDLMVMLNETVPFSRLGLCGFNLDIAAGLELERLRQTRTRIWQSGA